MSDPTTQPFIPFLASSINEAGWRPPRSALRIRQSGKFWNALWAALLVFATVTFLSSCKKPSSSDPISEFRPTRSSIPWLSLSFIPNRGQMNERVKFYGQSGSTRFFFARDEVVYCFVRKGASPLRVSQSALGKMGELGLRISDGKSGGFQFAFDNPRSAIFAEGKAVRQSSGQARGEVIRLQFVGANPNPAIEGQGELPGKVSYLIGHDPGRWRRDLPTYGQVRYRELWPGIDLVYRGQQGSLKYELLVRPGANPRQIQLAYRGIEGLRVTHAGELILKTSSGELRDSRPVAYQVIGGRRVEVEAGFQVEGTGNLDTDQPTLAHGLPTGPTRGLDLPIGASRSGSPLVYGFEVRGYNPGYPLVLDPGLEFATFLGGSNLDEGNGIALDSTGNVYVTGSTWSSNFPTTTGAFDPSHNGSWDAFVAKLSGDGSRLLYATFLGGSKGDFGGGIALDTTGNAYVVGSTLSPDFPTSAGAPPLKGSPFDPSYNGSVDAFVAKLSSDGSGLLYATFLGGSGVDFGKGIALDATGNAYVTGDTDSSDFPATAGAFDSTYNFGGEDAFVAKLSSDGSRLLYATFLGGGLWEKGEGIALDTAGNAYVAGWTRSSNFPATASAFSKSYHGGDRDAFVAKLSSDGSHLLYATFLGGDGGDAGLGIALDTAGDAYVTGWTDSPNFPTTAGAFDTSYNGGDKDAFVARLSSDGSRLLYATFLGGSGGDAGLGIALNAEGEAYMTGWTDSPNFPTTAGALSTRFNEGPKDASTVKLSSDGSRLLYATFLGGSNVDFSKGIAVDPKGNIYVIGDTSSPNFPATTGALNPRFNGGDSDAFVVRLNLR